MKKKYFDHGPRLKPAAGVNLRIDAANGAAMTLDHFIELLHEARIFHGKNNEEIEAFISSVERYAKL